MSTFVLSALSWLGVSVLLYGENGSNCPKVINGVNGPFFRGSTDKSI